MIKGVFNDMKAMDKKALNHDNVPDNSSMARNMEEMADLGKQMDKMSTNKELKEDRNLSSDPLQDS